MKHARRAIVWLGACWACAAHAQQPNDVARLRRVLGPAFETLLPPAQGEFVPSVRLLNDHAARAVRVGHARQLGLTGRGVVVGIVDSGLDVTHADFRNADGTTRVRWLLDYASGPRGQFAELEASFGTTVIAGKRGAVYDSAALNEMLASGQPTPSDSMGHGTHVAGTAAANARSPYAGMAPEADLVVVRVADESLPGIDTGNILRGVKFVFDRAAAEDKPAVVNLSLGSDFGPHDGTMAWERNLAELVGPSHPGRVVVAAAGNSGRPSDGTHEQVYVAPNANVRVRVNARRFEREESSVYVWLRFRPGASLRVGLLEPGGVRSVSMQSAGSEAGHNTSTYNTAVLTTGSKQQVVPSAAPGALVAWVGAWPSGDYEIELEGQGTADLFVSGDEKSVHAFYGGVRESTVGSPAAHPDILAVGATVNRGAWTTMSGEEINVPQWSFDRGGELDTRLRTAPNVGEVAAFSSAGPTTSGVPKPELVAPGAGIASAMSAGAPSSSKLSIFSSEGCPFRNGAQVANCFAVGASHAVSFGTSMATPVVTGAVALLLQADPTLSSDQVRALLQGGAQVWRTTDVFHEQGGVGELDVQGALAALSQMRGGSEALPVRAQSWVALSHAFASSVGTEPVTALLELRTATGAPADLFSLDRLRAEVRIGDLPVASPAITRMGPGLYRFEVQAPQGHGGEALAVGATFDGAAVVATRSLPIGSDPWGTFYGREFTGGCASRPASNGALWSALMASVSLWGLGRARRRLHR